MKHLCYTNYIAHHYKEIYDFRQELRQVIILKDLLPPTQDSTQIEQEIKNIRNYIKFLQNRVRYFPVER